MQDLMTGVNIPIGGFIDAARTHGWTLLPSCWAGAIPSSFVTRDAFERIADTIVADVRAAHLGRTTQVWDATVTHADTGKTIALFRCTQMVLWPKQ
jgi:hypothetical protein